MGINNNSVVPFVKEPYGVPTIGACAKGYVTMPAVNEVTTATLDTLFIPHPSPPGPYGFCPNGPYEKTYTPSGGKSSDADIDDDCCVYWITMDYLKKYDQQGNVLWTVALSYGAGDDSSATWFPEVTQVAVAFSSYYNRIICGIGDSVFVYDKDGNLITSATIAGPVSRIRCDSNGFIYVGCVQEFNTNWVHWWNMVDIYWTFWTGTDPVINGFTVYRLEGGPQTLVNRGYIECNTLDADAVGHIYTGEGEINTVGTIKKLSTYLDGFGDFAYTVLWTSDLSPTEGQSHPTFWWWNAGTEFASWIAHPVVYLDNVTPGVEVQDICVNEMGTKVWVGGVAGTNINQSSNSDGSPTDLESPLGPFARAVVYCLEGGTGNETWNYFYDFIFGYVTPGVNDPLAGETINWLAYMPIAYFANQQSAYFYDKVGTAGQYAKVTLACDVYDRVYVGHNYTATEPVDYTEAGTGGTNLENILYSIREDRVTFNYNPTSPYASWFRVNDDVWNQQFYWDAPGAAHCNFFVISPEGNVLQEVERYRLNEFYRSFLITSLRKNYHGKVIYTGYSYQLPVDLDQVNLWIEPGIDPGRWSSQYFNNIWDPDPKDYLDDPSMYDKLLILKAF